ncbi:hypothetical protein E2542_SST24389 [Spatholobus suberectus]|nr:hypothetical protein E2542_SST24389 [Spatholobus suberectus]
MENLSSQCSRVTLSTSYRKKPFCFCGVPCKVQMSSTSKNLGKKFFGCGRFDGYTKYCNFFSWCNQEDEVEENIELIALVTAQMSDILELHAKIEKMNNDLSGLSQTVETIKEGLKDVIAGIEGNADGMRKIRFLTWCIVIILLAKFYLFC